MLFIKRYGLSFLLFLFGCSLQATLDEQLKAVYEHFYRNAGDAIKEKFYQAKKMHEPRATFEHIVRIECWKYKRLWLNGHSLDEFEAQEIKLMNDIINSWDK